MEQHNAKHRSQLRLEDLNAYMSRVEKALDDLLSKITQLPIVDEQGNSECPFAEELHAYKEEAVALVEEKCKDLEPYLEMVEEEIKRCRRNLELIQNDQGNLELYETNEQYKNALEVLQNQLNNYIGAKNALIDLLTRKEELLKMAKEERHTWPLGEPERSDHFNINPEAVLNAAADGGYKVPQGPFDPKPVPWNSGLTSEINGLINLGPLY